MKKIYLALIVFVLAIVSCDQDNIGVLYEPGGPYVAFSSSIVVNNFLTAENNYSVTVQIVRSDNTSSETVGVSLEITEDIDGVFALESNTVTFNAGENVAYVKVIPLVEPTGISPGVTYNFNLSLSDTNVSEIFGETTYKASLKVDFTPIGTGIFTSEFFGDVWEVEILEANLGSVKLYKAIGLYEAGYDIIFIVDGTAVTVNEQATWYYDDDLGEVFLEGSGKLMDGELIVSLTHFIPGIHAWDPATEVLTLP